MENKRCKLLPNMAFVFTLTLTLISTLNLYYAIAQEEKMLGENSMVEMEIGSESNPKMQRNLETYIVHVNLPRGRVLSQSDDLKRWYDSFLPTSTASSSGASSSRMIYTYHNVISGFAAKLSPEEAKIMEKKPGFVSARPQRVFALHTTHSPNFLGLHQNLGFWNSSNYGKGVIIGVLDTGITPNHPSFSDVGMPPPPAKWKGKCEFNGTACNNKIIGARNFVSGESGPPFDEEGHGTHTASTAAGTFVEDVSLFGQANGTAVGMAPLAHLAIYKVCSGGCYESDILAAMDTAVEDGVDVLSLSLGGPSTPFYADAIALGAFAAIEKGIFVSCSAGNSGPYNNSLSNEAPWILTVGASTIDRDIRTTALLGNKDEIDGESVFQPQMYVPPTLLPLVYPGMNDEDAAVCGPGSLNNTDVKGKVVLCVRGGNIARIEKGQTVKDAGGAAMILMNEEPDGYSTLADIHVLPATHVGYKDGELIKAYINSTTSPTASILFRGTVIGVDWAPMVSSFSSRGPNWQSPGILKPDIIGPGVSILAAWPVPLDNTNTKSTFNIISGTSMSCPHLGGIAALLKSAHPDWSAAAIKSAIMTSADLLNLDKDPIIDERFLPADLFATGAGHVNPSRASDPGLIYDLKPDDYIPYLCGLGYTDRDVAVIVQHKVKCAEASSIPEAQLNYPSFSIALGSTDQTYTRAVTNVGEAASSYTATVIPPPGVEVIVEPATLDFSEVNQQMTYKVTFSRSPAPVTAPYVQGYLKWTSSKRTVTSPISVKLE